MTAQITDHVDQALERLVQQAKGQANLESLYTALATPAQACENALWQLLTERQVNTAVGDQLDAIGALVGQPRDGRSDDDYRRFVRAKIAANRSFGRVEDLLLVATQVINDPDATLDLKQLTVASVEFEVRDIVVDETLAGILISFLNLAKAAGVKLTLEYQTALDDDTLIFPPMTKLNGLVSAGATSITVESTADFPDAGTIILDNALTAEESVAYTSKTATAFSGFTLLNNHPDDTEVKLTSGTGLGLGDSTTPATGGKLAGATNGN